ncbi:MAG TPA: phenylalanine--tRNA ligase subunit alpha [Pseudoclavibacter sp.]|nr:phenylalanine--tRNA ligase subunit alpha [Pseudoclavibacter sp.]
MAENPELDEESVGGVVSEALAAIAAAQSTAELKTVRASHVAEGSPIATLNQMIGKIPREQRAAAGKLIGRARGEITKAYAQREAVLAQVEREQRLAEERVDVTEAAFRWRPGARHPLSLLQDEVSDIFVGMGWEIAEGPEIENEWFNFDALNFDADHPARAMQDTFFVDPPQRHLVMRTHTSPVQVRSMLERDLPIYILCPGRVYRTDELDATHTPVFHQFEGLAVDEGLTMADLKGTLEHFARIMFGPESRIRLRPSYFPFTEPSAELDVWFTDKKGGPGWVEWGGCGMVNPNVLRSAGIDPGKYSGFAFGMGVDRTLMFRNGVTDMHDIVEGDVRFSQQLGVAL